MPLLRKGEWVVDDGVAALALDEWLGLDDAARGAASAVALAPDDDAAALLPAVHALTRIDIDFPTYSDGRGYSQARVLRRAGFDGELRATGDVRRDQLSFMQRVGIDAALMPETLDDAALQATLHRITHVYQPSYPLPAANTAGAQNASTGDA